jgi:acyl-CoA synthetase (AMP-forming)/AMP-acid ligase II
MLHREPHRVVVTYVSLDGSSKSVRASELGAAAGAVALHIAALSLAPRSLVGIVHKSGLWLHAAWLGVIWAGHVPTMIAPPSPRMEPRKFADGLSSIVTHLGLDAVVFDAGTRNTLGDLMPAHIPAVMTDDMVPATNPTPPPAPVDLDAEVVVQHTSGTTGAQKAIGFTSRQIMIQAQAYAERLQLRGDDVVVSWLPLYHDMGFIACFVTPLVTGTAIVELSPFDWVQKPGLLFDAIGAHGGTFCWLPNFAFKVLSEDRLLATAAQREVTWPLDRVRAFINCSEPVTASAIDRFVTRLAPHGVRREQVIASYAMAENLFAVTQNELGQPRTRRFVRSTLEVEGRAVPAKSEASDSVELVSNGPPISTSQVEVRDRDGQLLPDSAVGQIHVAGTHLFPGYRRRSDLTAEVMDARGFYATGDLGFLCDGEVYVTGRSKDLIIIRGRNYYPHDVEALVGEIEGVNPGRVVAFGVPDDASGTEKLILMLELLEGSEAASGQIALAVRRKIAQSLDCTVGDLRIVPPRTLVKSTSGKLARADNRHRYLAMTGAA